MRRLLSVLSIFISVLASAQGIRVVSPGQDSVSIAAIRSHLDKIRESRPTVALVLSGGGAKGAAQIGALRYLDSLAIPVDIVFGTSIGGLLGGLYATGYTQPQMDSLIRSLDWQYLLTDRLPRRYSRFSRKQEDVYHISIPLGYLPKEGKGSRITGKVPSGFIPGRNVSTLLTSLTVGYQDSTDFISLPTPFVCVATELVTGTAKVWYGGHLTSAMRSTMSIPGLFAPVKTGGMVLTDGGQRDNFPVDIARACGADIVIGIDLSQGFYGYDKINTIADVLMQSIDMLGREIYEENVKHTDVTIKPDLKGYDMMSFNPKSIEIMIGRGYEAALAKADTLKGILRRTGPRTEVCGEDGKPAKKAVDINLRKVRVGKVEIDGVSEQEAEYLRRKIDVEDFVGRKELEEYVSILSGTGAFESVTSRMLGTEEPYTLVIYCKKGPSGVFSAGGRMDNEELISALFRLGFNVNGVKGSSFEAKAKVGVNPYIDAIYRYKTSSGMAFNAALYYKYVGKSDFRIDSKRTDVFFHNFRQELYFSNESARFSRIRLGLRNEYFKSHTVLSEKELSGIEIPRVSQAFISVFSDFSADTFDESYFPHKGFKFTAGYSWTPFAYKEDADAFHTVSFDGSTALSPSSWLTFQPSLYARTVFGGDRPLPYLNVAGGLLKGRYLPQHIPFVGMSAAKLFDDALLVGRLDARFRLFKDNYLTTIYNFAAEAPEPGKIFSSTSAAFYHGAGLEYAYNSVIGPLKAGVCWSDITKTVGGYFSFGFNF